MKRLLVFMTDPNYLIDNIFDNEYEFQIETCHNEFIKQKNEFPYYDIATTCLHFLSFDLLDDFSQIFILHKGVKYELKLGANTWTKKELRKEHNLFKLVMNNIVNA